MAQGALEIVFPGRTEKCSVFFGDDFLERLPGEMFSGVSTLAIVTDDIVKNLYSKQLLETCSGIAKTRVISFLHGERNKNLSTVSRVAKRMSDLSFDRKSAILALGGGVVGDLSGFVASVFKRGIKYYQFPTTLLAQVDSSLGGKCGVDTEWGKNQIGTFYQPAGIFVDSSVLDSLPKNEVVNGLAEIVKSGIIADRAMFEEMESNVEDYFSIQKLKSLVSRTCQIKAKVVEEDEREAGVRKILNYGHTVGHAIESSSGYKISHGKCVTLGMLCEAWIAHELGILDEADFIRQRNLLWKIKNHFKIGPMLDRKTIFSFALLDKKNSEGTIKMSLPEKLGKMYPGEDGGFSVTVSKKLFLESLSCLGAKAPE